MMDQFIPNHKEIAFHEAAHAVTGFFFFPPVEEVTILPNNEMYSTLGHTKSEMPFMDLGDPEDPTVFKMYLKVIINLCSARYFQQSVRGIDDRAGAAADFDFLKVYLHTSELWFSFALIRNRVVAYFCENSTVKKMVKVVAEALEQKNTLIHDDLNELLEKYEFDHEVVIDDIYKAFFNEFISFYKVMKPWDSKLFKS